MAFDNKGNIGIQFSHAGLGSGVENIVNFGFADLGAEICIGVYNVDTIFDLEGGAVQYGASGAIPGKGISLGIDAVILLDNKYDLFDGILLTLGVGIGYDFHVLSPKTEETHVLKSAEKHTRDYKKRMQDIEIAKNLRTQKYTSPATEQYTEVLADLFRIYRS